MTIELKITAASLDDLKHKTAAAFADLHPDEVAAAEGVAKEKAPAKPRKPRGRKPKLVEVKAEEEVVDVEEVEEIKEAKADVTRADALEAIKSYCEAFEKANPENETAQRQAFLNVLDNFDAKKLSDVPDDKYGDVKAYAEKLTSELD